MASQMPISKTLSLPANRAPLLTLPYKNTGLQAWFQQSKGIQSSECSSEDEQREVDDRQSIIRYGDRDAQGAARRGRRERVRGRDASCGDETSYKGPGKGRREGAR
ncbi:hypothetical protein HPP92_009847 [Vanilla planifolia]|uniref:Uncharacterized protein n=1 Tax=Vanilla planifolia TaxID=51239 RepID=A0A835V5U8_VANPL|nr:hypothetical protein HPP92_009847 [Vanilla planifolia]